MNRVNPNNPGLREQVSGQLSEAGDAEVTVFSQREPLRQPRTSPPILEDSSRAAGEGRRPSQVASNNRDAVQVDGVINSNLSVNAAEFYPSGYNPQEPVYEDGEDHYYPETLAELETLRELVELIYTQSTSIPNFSYTGARLCNHLSRHLTLNSPGNNFRQLLLHRCQAEFDQRDQAVRGDEATQKSFHSYVLFLGELYLNLEIKGPTMRAEILLTALRKLLDSLFSNPEDRNLICAVKLLKLTGSVLEDTWKEKGSPDMDELVKKIEIILLDASCSRDVRQMLLKLVELRSSDWGRVQGAAATSEATPDNDPNYFMNEPTFYMADGTPFTAADPEYSEKYQEILDREDYFPDPYEENGNEQYDEYENGMDPEIEEAYETFCLESEQKRKQ
ncbi:hypothetical protein AGOR_G00047550 [Albula goreensis]|uniref:Polyadenylate-binding protein-interacting protein 1 n=1 Tax=Albula goreensis TaxID=1534307 RepID=A0A8T3DRY4_9TELE|nr:hypothetical protein AGOR_G00047550 [Albula goreensis]